MRISDWSSDVCSSDLWIQARSHQGTGRGLMRETTPERRQEHPTMTTLTLDPHDNISSDDMDYDPRLDGEAQLLCALRSEERRVGKKCVRTGRSQWAKL